MNTWSLYTVQVEVKPRGMYRGKQYVTRREMAPNRQLAVRFAIASAIKGRHYIGATGRALQVWEGERPQHSTGKTQ